MRVSGKKRLVSFIDSDLAIKLDEKNVILNTRNEQRILFPTIDSI